MIAAAISFNSGILLFADAEHEAYSRFGDVSRKIFPRQYGANRGCACSIFVASEPAGEHVAVIRQCERALESVPPVACTIDRMRETIEQSLEASLAPARLEPSDQGFPFFVVAYSPCEQRYSLFQTAGTALQEVAEYHCQGTAAYLGHYLIRDQYHAARSMDTLDLTTVFSLASQTLAGIRARHNGCGESSEMVVMYADGHVSDVQRIPHDTRRKRDLALTGLAHT